MVGQKLRVARHSRGMSLNDVATRASISAATLSRIENEKQAVDVEMLLTLSSILSIEPADLFERPLASEADPLAARFAGLDSKSRAKIWNELAAAARQRKGASTTLRQKEIDVDEMLAQLDYLRAEIESVKRRIR